MNTEHTGDTIEKIIETVDRVTARNQPGRIDPFCTCNNNGDYCDFCAAKEDVFTTNGIEPLDEYERRTR
jgi:hypothetical protein